MTFVPTTWVDGVTVANAAQLNRIEAGISAAAPYVTSITATGTSGPSTVVSGVLNVPQYSGGDYDGGNASSVYGGALTIDGGTS